MLSHATASYKWALTELSKQQGHHSLLMSHDAD